MKPLLVTALVLLPFAATAADTPSRWSGLFGFGTSKQKEEQISAGLFPSQSQGNPAPPVASPVATAPDESIFRGGEPQKVEPVSYVIENGQKVEKEVDRKKSSIFSFGKREDSSAVEDQVLAPVPAATSPAPISATPVPATPIVAVPNAATTSTPPIAATTATPNATPVAAPAPEASKESRFGWLPFLSKKKEEPIAPAAAPVVSTPVSAPVMTQQTPPSPAGTAMNATATGQEAAKPATSPAQPAVSSFEVPKKTETEVEKPKPEGGGILAPIAKIRPPKKEIDLTNAETIIQNGEIVTPTETNFDSTPTSAASTERRPPAVVNGVKTYSSWDDVEGKSTSAADRIINQIR